MGFVLPDAIAFKICSAEIVLSLVIASSRRFSEPSKAFRYILPYAEAF